MRLTLISISAPNDYTAFTVVLTFTPMETRVCYNVNIENDVVYEGPEDFLIGLSTMDARIDLAPDSARITIVDDDGNNLLLVTIFIVFVGCTYLFNVVGYLFILLVLALK